VIVLCLISVLWNVGRKGGHIANQSVDMRQMNQPMGIATNSMGHSGSEINESSNAQRMMPLVLKGAKRKLRVHRIR
jgi:hypothetical protein